MSQAGFEACLPTTLSYEGGLSMRRDDPGNWTSGKIGVGTLKGTMMGIAASAHPNLDIQRLTKADVAAIYQREYWAPAGCDRLPVGLDLCHFDGTVNSGLGHSRDWLKASASAIAMTDRIHAYSGARLRSMQGWKAWLTFRKGWSARVAGVEAKAITMASTAPASAKIAIAEKGAEAAAVAKTAGAAAHVSTAIAAGGVVEAATAHPYLGALAAVIAAASAIWNAFHASTSGARAATLAHAASL